MFKSQPCLNIRYHMVFWVTIKTQLPSHIPFQYGDMQVRWWDSDLPDVDAHKKWDSQIPLVQASAVGDIDQVRGIVLSHGERSVGLLGIHHSLLSLRLGHQLPENKESTLQLLEEKKKTITSLVCINSIQ